MSFHRRLVEKLREAIVDQCKVGDCDLNMEGAPNPRTIVQCDKLCNVNRGPMCDFVLFLGEPSLTIAAVEIKSKAWNARRVVRQLQAGAQFAEEQAHSLPVCGFFPLLLTMASKHPAQLKVLGQGRIRFRGDRYRIILRRCGASLRRFMPAR